MILVFFAFLLNAQMRKIKKINKKQNLSLFQIISEIKVPGVRNPLGFFSLFEFKNKRRQTVWMRKMGEPQVFSVRRSEFKPKKQLRSRKGFENIKLAFGNTKNNKQSYLGCLKLGFVEMWKVIFRADFVRNQNFLGMIKLIFVSKKIRVSPKKISKKTKQTKQVATSQSSLGVFLVRYKAHKASHGKNYWRRYCISVLLKKLQGYFVRFLIVLRGVSWRSGVAFSVLLVIFSILPSALSAPRSKSISTKQDWDKATNVNLSTESKNDAIQLAAAGSWNARVWAPAPDTISYGHSSAVIDGYLYSFRGYSDKAFWRFDIANNKWETLTDLPQPAYYGADMVYDGSDSIYAIFGGYSQKFYKYSISGKSWIKLPDLLDTPWQGAAVETDGTNIFVVRGNGSTDFWRFNVADNNWSNLAPVPVAVGAGGDIVNGQDGYLYLTRGASTLTFYRYKISGTGGNTWTAQANVTTGYTFTSDQRGTYYNGNIYFFRSGGTTSFLRFNLAGNSWTVLSGANEFAPAAVNYGSIILNPSDNKLYALRSNGTTDLWKFDPVIGANGEWEGPKQILDGTGTVGTGGDLIWNKQTGASNYVYAIRGGSNAFYRYDVTANTWLTKANLPASISTDVKATYCNGYVYALLGSNATTFYRFLDDASTGAWTTLTAQPLPAAANNGAGLVCASDNSLYAIRGNGAANLYRYTDAGGWTSLTNIVVGSGANAVTYYTNIGARIATNGTDIFVMPGDGETAFLKYSGGTWTNLSATPFAQQYGTDMIYANGKIYALAGLYKDDTWEYDVAANSWRRLPNNQQYTFGRGPYNGASIEYAGGYSFFATTGQSLADIWSYTAANANYLLSGTYQSETIDLANVANWISFTKNDDKPTNTNIIYETRTSSDNQTWSEWQQISGSSIASPVGRYLQVQATLSTSDGNNTPTVFDYTVSYSSEDEVPVNPSVTSAYSQQTNGVSLNSGQVYRYEHPYFAWSGATDSGSGVDGYYVYFGTNVDADPQTNGQYQSSSFYIANEALTEGTYYLKIKTKDANGNVNSDSYDAFTYQYAGVSPFLSEEKTTKVDFDKGTLTNVTSASVDGSLRLDSTAGFWNESRLSLAPGNIAVGGELALGQCRGSSNHCLYTFAGASTATFYRYEIETDTWTASPSTLAAAPLTVGAGGFIVAGPEGYLYAVRGLTQPTFWVYDIANNVWNTLDSAPKNFYYGSSLSYDGTRYVYAMPGNDDAIFKYDTCNGLSDCTPSWTQLVNAEFGNPNTVDGQKTYAGSDGVYDGRNNIYSIQGNLYPYFAKYSIAENIEKGERANAWTTLAPLPEGTYDGGTIEYDRENNVIYALIGKSRQKFYRFDPEVNTWFAMPDVPAAISYGASMVVYDGYVYVTRGATTTNFYRFNIAENSWEIPQRAFFGPSTFSATNYFAYGEGTVMASADDENIYIARGQYDNTFGSYNVSTGTFTELARLPVGAYTGSSMVFVGSENAVYYIPGNIRTRRTGDTKNPYFFKYDVATNVWQEIVTDRPPLQTLIGSSMTFDGSQYIYLTAGNATNTWWRYDVTAAAGSRWSAALPTNASCLTGDGGKIVYKNGFIYLLRATGQTTTCRYTVSSSTWTVLGTLPAAASTGANMVDGKDGYLYVARGANTNDYYRYNTAQATPGAWEALTSTKIPANVTGGGFAAYASNRNWVVSGAGTNSYADGLYSYVIGSQDNATGFQKTGTYESEAMDFISVYRWANLTVDYTAPQNTFVSFETRTSGDGVEWSDWSQTSNEHVFGTKHVMNITSVPASFVQLRINFTSADQIFSPKVDNFAINYYQDIQAPNNPAADAVKAYSDATHTAEISATDWNRFANPSFVWPQEGQIGGAVDNVGGSGITGYYVYFGNSSDADAFILGNFQTSNVYTASNLVSGKAYYLKIKAVDNANMIPMENCEAFTYKFDVNPPTNPSAIEVTPTGYTAIDNYSFLWSPDAADDYAGVAKFQYRTDGDEPNVWVDINDAAQFQLTIPNAEHIVGAYQSGKNKLYLRTVDNAGNVSEPMVQEYYYSASAPTPPQNLVASPDSSQTNNFAFSWQQPASFIGEVDKLIYYYSVNVLPTPNNVVATSIRAAGPGSFATQKGKNTFFVVAADQAGNIEYNNYAQVDFNADTAAPGVPGNIQIFDTSDRENSEYSVAVKWIKPAEFNSGNFDGYVIYRSEDNATFTEVAKTTGSAYVDTKLESKIYYYYIKAKDKTNNYSIASTIVSLVPTGRYTTPPKLVGTPNAESQPFQATINWTTDRVASSFIEYGKTISLGQTTGQVDSLTSHEVITKGLDADTKYFYRVKYIDPDGNIGTSEIDTFETLPPPTISEVAVNDIQLNTAYVSWKTNTSATCSLEYGSGGSSMDIEEETGGSSHVQKIDKLQPATVYSVQISCLDGDLNNFKSDEYSFATPEEPTVSDVTVENKENVDLPTVVVSYKTNVPTSTYILFKGAHESSPHTFLLNEKVTEHSAEITGLDPSVEYLLQISGVDEHNIEARKIEQKITTRFDSRPPMIVTNRAIGRVMGRGKSAQANVYIRIETDEPTKIKIGYAKGIVTKSFEQTVSDDSFNTYHLVTIPAESGQVYSYQINAFDEAENLTTSEAMTIAVDQSRANATEVITSTFLNQFGWIAKLGGN